MGTVRRYASRADRGGVWCGGGRSAARVSYGDGFCLCPCSTVIALRTVAPLALPALTTTAAFAFGFRIFFLESTPWLRRQIFA